MELTKVERLILTNQYRILEKLDPNQVRYYKEAREILEGGFTLSYNELASNIDQEMSEAKCHEVRDVLDLYRALKKALRELPEGSLAPEDATFKGFDGNEESEHYAYARFLIETQGKWEESKDADLNSRGPMLEQYRPMVEGWKQSTKKWDLTAEDVARILDQK
jgi:hypothetical protein